MADGIPPAACIAAAPAAVAVPGYWNGCTLCMMSAGNGVDGGTPARRFRYRRYFCKWLATFSLVIPSTFMSCKMVFGTAFLIPRWFTAFMKRMWSSGVHTSRGFFGCLPPPPPPPPPPPWTSPWTSSSPPAVVASPLVL